MKGSKRSLLSSLALAAALAAPVVMATATNLEAQRIVVRRVYDRDNRDYHNWDAREDRSYRVYTTQQNRRYRVYTRLNRPQQRLYWKWRHANPDRD